MKVSLHLSTDTLIAANQLLQRLYELPVFPSSTKNVYKSIGFDVADKLDKKVKNVIKKGEISKNKIIKLNLKFHEAWGLEKIIIDLISIEENDYHRNLLNRLSGEINQIIT